MVSEDKDLVLKADEYPHRCRPFLKKVKAPPATRARGTLCGSFAKDLRKNILRKYYLLHDIYEEDTNTTPAMPHLPETGNTLSRGETTKRPLSDCPVFHRREVATDGVKGHRGNAQQENHSIQTSC